MSYFNHSLHPKIVQSEVVKRLKIDFQGHLNVKITFIREPPFLTSESRKAKIYYMITLKSGEINSIKKFRPYS